MSYEQRENSGAIFVNERKEKETHPDRSGTARIDGKDYYVSGWLRDTKAGQKYLSLAFKPKLASDKASPPTGGRNDPRPEKFDDSDVPW